MKVDSRNEEQVLGESKILSIPPPAWDTSKGISQYISLSAISSSSFSYPPVSTIVLFTTPVASMPSLSWTPQYSAGLILSNLVHAQIQPYIQSIHEAFDLKLSKLPKNFIQDSSTSAPTLKLTTTIEDLWLQVSAIEGSITASITKVNSHLASCDLSIADCISALCQEISQDWTAHHESSEAFFQSVKTEQEKLVKQITDTVSLAKISDDKVQGRFNSIKQLIDATLWTQIDVF